jgi:hypothetical protein
MGNLTLVIPSFAQKRFARFDKFPRKASTFNGITNPYAFSLNTFIVTEWILADGNSYFYLWNNPMSFTDSSAYLTMLGNYVTPNYPGFWIGEMYNHVVRPLPILKFNTAGFIQFLADN